MKVFQTVRSNYELLGISAAQSLRRFPHNPKIFCTFVLFGLVMTSFVAYFFHVADTSKEYIEGATTTSSCIIFGVCYGSVVLQMTELFENFKDMEEVIEMRSKYPASKALFEQANQRVEKWCKIIFFVIMKFCLPSIVLPVCIGSLIIYMSADLGNESLVLPLPVWFPFDTRNPLGYFTAISIVLIVTGYGCFVAACAASLGIGSYILVVSTVQDLKGILRSISKCTKIKSEQKRQQMNQNLREFIEMHSEMKRLVQSFGVLAQPIFMTLFTWSLVAISAGLLALQIQMTHHKFSIELLLLLLEAAYGFGGVFLSSELGQRIANKAFSYFMVLRQVAK